MNQSAQTVSNAYWRDEIVVANFITITTFILAGVCFYWYALSGEIAMLLLGWVTFGTAFDFLSHLLGRYFAGYRGFLKAYSRINFAALCFGIPFTALAGSFVIAEIVPGGINAQMLEWWPQILTASLCFGTLFLVARYRQYSINGSVEFTLDKSNLYTHVIFIARRAYLAVALFIGVAVMVDGFGTEWALWTIAFGLSFIATVPLHIMRKQIPSMLSEVITLYILAFGSWSVFVG